MQVIPSRRGLRTTLALSALAASVIALGDTGVVTVNASLPYTPTNWSNALQVPKFDSSLGTLDSVDISFHGAIHSTMRFENKNSSARPYSASVGYTITLTKPGGDTLIVSPTSSTVSGNLEAFDGVVDYAGPSGVNYPLTQIDSTGTATITDTATLATFLGTGTVPFPVDANAASRVTASGNFDRVIETDAAADIQVTYHYTFQRASVGDYVWFDKNQNGLQDADEAGVGNVTVLLLDGTGATVGTTTTDGTGKYLFSNLLPGDYQVKFVAPAGSTLTTADAGDDNLDSDAGAGGLAPKITLHSGENRRDIDAGIVGLQSLGDRVWFDTNANGKQDANEPGIANVGVTLLDTAGNVLGVASTDANGIYSFTGLLPGDYKVKFDIPAGYVISPLSAGSDKTVDSDAKPDGTTATVTLNAGDNRTDIDAGMYGLVSLGDRLWFDANANGKQDDGEKGIANVDVTLLTSGGTAIKTVQTDANGNYLFDGLTPGDYRVKFARPTGYSFTGADAGSDDNIDSDVDSTGLTPIVTVTSDRLDVDAGVVGTLCLGDRVWLDCNSNGLQDNGEPGVKAVAVRLIDSSGNVIAETVTDNNGYYKFSNLAPGDYIVDFDAPAGYGFTKQFANASYKQYDSNADVVEGKASVTLTSNDLTIDAGLIGALKIGDTVWVDSDGDGKYEPEVGELGIPGVKVYLVGDTNNDGWPDFYATTTTDKDGHYLFQSLKPGTYAVTVNGYDIPSRLTQSYDLDGIGTKNIAIGKLTTTDRLDFDFGYKPSTVCNGGSNHCWWSCNLPKWSCDNIWVGGKCHSKTTVCNWMKKADCGDKSICVYQRLCAAKLNVGNGCNESTVINCGKVTCSVKDAIKRCDDWMKANPVGCRVGTGSNWNSICDYYGILDKFCNR